jgi:hypothetical protein
MSHTSTSTHVPQDKLFNMSSPTCLIALGNESNVSIKEVTKEVIKRNQDSLKATKETHATFIAL